LGGEFSPFCEIFFYKKEYSMMNSLFFGKEKVSQKNLNFFFFGHNLPNYLQHERVLILFLFFIFLNIAKSG